MLSCLNKPSLKGLPAQNLDSIKNPSLKSNAFVRYYWNF